MDRRYIIHDIILHHEYHNTVMLFLFKSIYILKETFSRHASFHPWSSCMYNMLQNIQAHTQTHTHLDILDTIQTMRHPDYIHWSTKLQKDHSNFIKKEIYEMKINGRFFLQFLNDLTREEAVKVVWVVFVLNHQNASVTLPPLVLWQY